MIEQDEMENRFTYHPPNSDEVVAYYVSIRKTGREFAEMINEIVPDGREKSIALTRIEEAIMWANAGIARSDT